MFVKYHIIVFLVLIIVICLFQLIVYIIKKTINMVDALHTCVIDLECETT